MIKAFESNSNIVDVKAVGTSMRFLAAYLSQCPGEKIITGIERMKNRPIHMLVDALNLLGADIKYAEKKDTHRSISKENCWMVAKYI